MTVIAVDDEQSALNILRRAVGEIVVNANIACFESAEEALKYAQDNRVDIAFLDIEMDEMNGLILAKHLKDIYSETNIIFVTGYSNYMGEAFNIRASGYVLKPINPKHVKEEIDNLRNPVKLQQDGIYIQCFGNFEVFKDGKPILFNRSKSKEALAYLIDRKGASVSKKELAAILMEKEEYSRGVQAYMHNIITEMVGTLKEAKAENIIIKNRNSYSVDITKFSCDYYNYIRGDTAAINSYAGEYMANYSWGEFRIQSLYNEQNSHAFQ